MYFMSEIFHDNCGVGAVADLANQQNVTYLGARIAAGLQNRGDLGAGLNCLDISTGEPQMRTIKGPGLVKDVLSPTAISESGIIASSVIAHTRYATNGSLNPCYFQPFHYPHDDPRQEFAFAFNGNIPDCSEHLAYLASQGIMPSLDGDTEVIGQLLVNAISERSRLGMKQVLRKAWGNLDGAFNPVVMTREGDIFAVRDRHGFHPLVYGRHDSLVAIASEDSAIRHIWPHAEIHDVPPGHMLRVDMHRKDIFMKELWTPEKQHCFFEWMYFANHTSNIDGTSVANARYECGKVLAEQDNAWMYHQKNQKESRDWPKVVPVPESAKIAANGYADTHGLRRVDVILKNPDIGRTFTSSGDRTLKALAKYDIDPDLVRGQSIILVDDSMVRGTTMRVLVQQLRDMGAREIHLRLASPPILAPCFYGLDFPTVSELVARKYCDGIGANGVIPDDILDAIAKDLGVDSVRYLPLSTLPRVLKKQPYDLCTSCVTGKYPTEDGQRLYEIENAKNKLQR